MWCKVLVVNVVFIRPCPALYREAGIEVKIDRVLKGIFERKIIFSECNVPTLKNKTNLLHWSVHNRLFHLRVWIYIYFCFFILQWYCSLCEAPCSGYCLYFPCPMAFPNGTAVIFTANKARWSLRCLFHIFLHCSRFWIRLICGCLLISNYEKTILRKINGWSSSRWKCFLLSSFIASLFAFSKFLTVQGNNL